MIEKGQVLNAEVAQRLFGFRWRVFDNGFSRHNYLSPPDERPSKCRKLGRDKTARDLITVLPCSTDLVSAWKVVEKMESLGYCWNFCHGDPMMPNMRRRPWAHFWRYTNGVLDKQGQAGADELPEAICRAALAALEYK